MGFALWILFGVVVGVAITRLMPGPSGGDSVAGIVVGIAGGVLGGLIGTLSAGEASTAFDTRGLLMAICGSLLVMFCYRCLAMREAY
jgi:uncharacterized membrane protein YeaQ/YmgE (transglycosylase-associated protein family)